ncbi:MAG: hypothetical protein H7235_05055 [Bdellovibrionaceae bacterium]|nr:hypothetical protein [Pseudobdellovibrionaceae bacterium]
MNSEPINKNENKKPEQTPADLQMNQDKKNIDSERQSQEQVPSSKQFVKPTEKTPDHKNQPAT